MRLIDEARRAFAGRVPRQLELARRAAVAIVLHAADDGDEVLFIERARRLGDPWSGHMAFPGGRVGPEDASARDAAVRETREEVGLDLAPAELLGRLDDVAAGVPLVAPFALSAFAYCVPARAPLEINGEVEEALWVPCGALLDPARHTGYRLGLVKLPGICVGQVDRHVVWGLTYRLLESFFATLGQPLRTPAFGWLGRWW